MANFDRVDGEAASFLALLRERAALDPNAPAIGAPGRPTQGRAGLLALVEGVGARLREAGVGRGDRVAIVLPNGPEMATAFFGVASFATAAPLNPAYRDAELSFFLGDLEPRALIVGHALETPARAVAARLGVPVIELVPAPGPAGAFSLELQASGAASSDDQAGADDVALVLHTSGTTSRPKMVPLAQKNLLASARSIAATLGLGPADRALNVMPLYHIHGLVAATLASIVAGASVFATPGFDAARFFAWYDEVRPTWYTAVPTMHQAVLAATKAHAEILGRHRLRFARSSSAALPPPLMRELEAALGAPLLEAYGMTEAAHQMASNPLPPAVRKPGTVGRATGVEIAILDADGATLGPNTRGEIAIRGPSVTAGYLENPAANATAFTHGFFRTGDEGSIDDDGYLTISGRLKEIINKAGEKISPREIDEVVILHPAVLQVVTFALPHPTLGEDVGAAIVVRPGASLDQADLRHFCSDRLADFKVPQRVLVVTELPKGPTGKLKRVGLAEHFAAELAAGDHVAPRSELEEKLVRLVAAELGLDRVGVHDNYFALGGDSLQAVMLAAKGRAAGVPFSPVQLFAHPTVAELAIALANGAATLDEPVLEATGDARARVAGLVDRAPEEIEDAFLALPFSRSIVQRYEPRLSPSAFVTSWSIHGRLDVGFLRQAFARVAARHPALRSGFVAPAEEPPIQFVARTIEVDVDVHGGGGSFDDLVAEAHRRPFDLAKPPLFRVVVFREHEDRHRIASVWLHAIADLWSVGLVEREVFATHDALAAGREIEASRESASFAAFARGATPAGREPEQRTFWRAELDGLTEHSLLRFFRGPEGFRLPSGERETVRRPLDAALLEKLGAWARANAVTPSTILHGAWALVQSRYLGIDDLLFGSVVSGRWGDVARIEAIVGPTMEVLPVRARIAGDMGLGPWLRELQGRLAELQRFAHTPWETIAASFTPPRRNVPAWSTIVVENLPAELWERPASALTVSGFEHATHMTPPFLLSFFPAPRPHLKATFDPSFVSTAAAGMLLDGVLDFVRGLEAAEIAVRAAAEKVAGIAPRWPG